MAKATKIEPQTPADDEWVDNTCTTTEGPAWTPPKVKKPVTYQLLKKVDGVPVYIRITSAIFVGKAIAGNPGQEKMEPASLVRCINLQTGEEQEMIVNKALEGALVDAYPDESYVGKGFMVEQYTIPGKRYKGYKIAELDI